MNGSVRARRAAGLSTGLAILALLGTLSFATFGAAKPVAAQEEAVDIVDFSFSPATLEIEVGTTVTWTNGDSAPHTATADDGSFDTGTLNEGESGSVTFDTAGTFTYHCSVHPNMTATIVVTAPGGDSGDTGDSGGEAAAPSTNLPSTGVGPALALDTGATSPVVVLLVVLASALGLTGLALRRVAH
jgi:plastocyanin